MCPQRTKFISPFAPLHLFESDDKMLEELSITLVSNYVAQYEEFLRQGGCAGVDERVWKPIKERDNVRVFVQRTTPSDDGGMDGIRESIDNFADCGAVQPSDLPVVLTVASVPGNLDDLMYGLMSPTVETMRVKTSYIDDQFADAAVLHTIAVPTKDDPFQSLVIKWALTKQKLLLRSVTSDRDFVYMERTGIVHTSTGERIAFHLLHSVDFPQTHELPRVERGNISVCGIAHDDPDRNQAKVFVQAIVDPRGSAPRAMVIQAAADMFIVLSRYVKCSYHKKLMWRLRMKQKSEDLRASTHSSLSDKLDLCAVCNRPPSKVRNALSGAHKRRCALCTKCVCSSCTIKKTLKYVTSATSKLYRREFTFCRACYIDTCRSDAFDVAREEFMLAGTMDEGTSFSFRKDFYSFISISDCS